MGTPDFAVPTLEALISAGHDIAAVYTQPPRPAGRGKRDRLTSVHIAANAHGLTVETPNSLKPADVHQTFLSYRPDVAVVIAYGQLLPALVLDGPVHGCLNLHGSLLPRWRGAAPIQRAIMAGDAETGVSVMRMEQGLDTGPVCLERRITIADGMTAGELHDEMASAGAPLMVQALADLEAGGLACDPQGSQGVTYAGKIEKSETRIDFDRDAQDVLNQIHGLSPWPGAWLELPQGSGLTRVKILKAERSPGSGMAGTVLDDRLTIACRAGAISPLRVQREGKGVMDLETFLRGFQVRPGVIAEQ